MDQFKEYLKNKIAEYDKEANTILDIDTKRKKIYRKEVCMIFLELISEYENKAKESENNE